MQTVRFATYNIECLGISSRKPQPDQACLEAVQETIQSLQADVVSLTEAPDERNFLSFYDAKLKSEFPHMAFLQTDPRSNHNAAILSKFPIGRWQVHSKFQAGQKNSDFTRGVGSADIEIPSAPTRLFVHHSKADPYYATLMSEHERQIKLEQCQTKRHQEWSGLTDLAQGKEGDNGANPKVLQLLTGDFNDTPASFAYHTLSTHLQDAFLQAGWGIGPTYSGFFQAYRIDYIFAGEKFSVKNYNTICANYSDHYPVTCSVAIKK